MQTPLNPPGGHKGHRQLRPLSGVRPTTKTPSNLNTRNGPFLILFEYTYTYTYMYIAYLIKDLGAPKRGKKCLRNITDKDPPSLSKAILYLLKGD